MIRRISAALLPQIHRRPRYGTRICRFRKMEQLPRPAPPVPRCDGVNVVGFQGTLSLPLKSKFMVGRLDHDFGSKQHFMASYRYFNQQSASDDQVDIGGAFPGDKLGTPASLSGNPVEPWYLVVGWTSNITTNTTNDIHYSYLRNWWAWNRAGDHPGLHPLCWPRRSARARKRPVEASESRSLQRQYSANSYPLLGWQRSDVPRRCIHAERESPVSIWGHLPA